MSYHYYVITDEGDEDDGCCDAVLWPWEIDVFIPGPEGGKTPLIAILGTRKIDMENYDDKEFKENVPVAFYTKSHVFSRGEIVICDPVYGREIGGGRKPSKWFVGYEVYNDIEKAIRRAIVIRESSLHRAELPPSEDEPIEVQIRSERRAECEAMGEAVAERLRTMTPEEIENSPLGPLVSLLKKVGGG